MAGILMEVASHFLWADRFMMMTCFLMLRIYGWIRALYAGRPAISLLWTGRTG
ncbi:hypothetical protein SACS_0691 [Parasaccharibacter apium]|uniref:Uncharacterized protein n=1 Tax=Parasaccharibacter apium TaxID=1510841 RepID=A0A7U7G5B5_9PROT|nr:hypothetical protein SACS_0691 [Parasaccharibacter apium]